MLLQVMSMVFGIVMARILTPHDYGMFAVLIIFTTMAALLQESGFIVALINKKNVTDEDYNSVFWFSCSMGVTLYLLLYALAPFIARYYHAPELTAASRVLFIWFLFGCTCTVHNAVLIRHLMMKERAKADVAAFIVSCIVGVTMAVKGMGYWSLIMQMVVQGCVSSLMRWYFSPWRPKLDFSFMPLKEMFPFSIKLLLTGVVNVVNSNIFAIILGRYYTKEQTGFYNQGYKWAYTGYSVIWGMVNNVSQPVLAQVADTPERQVTVFRKLVRFVMFVTCPCMLGLAFVAPEFIIATVTDKWLESVPFMQIFCLWGLITPINNLCTNAIVSHGKSDVYMYGTIALDVVQLGVIYLTSSLGLYPMMASYIAVNFVWFFVWFYFLHRRIPVVLAQMLWRDMVPYLGVTLLSIGIAWVACLYIDNLYVRLFAKIGIVAVLYITVLYLMKSVMLKETLQYLSKKKFK